MLHRHCYNWSSAETIFLEIFFLKKNYFISTWYLRYKFFLKKICKILWLHISYSIQHLELIALIGVMHKQALFYNWYGNQKPWISPVLVVSMHALLGDQEWSEKKTNASVKPRWQYLMLLSKWSNRKCIGTHYV